MLKGNIIAVAKKAALKHKLGKWRVYDVVFMTKRATLITDHEIRQQYKHLYHVTDNFFIGLSKNE